MAQGYLDLADRAANPADKSKPKDPTHQPTLLPGSAGPSPDTDLTRRGSPTWSPDSFSAHPEQGGGRSRVGHEPKDSLDPGASWSLARRGGRRR